MPKTKRLRYSADGTTWSMADVANTAPDTVTNLRSDDVGNHPDNFTYKWDAAPRATKYNIYVGWDGQATYLSDTVTTTSVSVTSMGDDVNHWFYIEGENAKGEKSPSWSNILKVRSGHLASGIAAGTGYVSRSFSSHNHLRAGSWNYDGGGKSKWGWYNTEAYRYQGFWEIAPEHMWGEVARVYPALTNYRNSVSSTGFGMFITRDGSTGDWGSDNYVHVSLGNGISYGNGAWFGETGNAQGITIKPNSSGQVGYGIPGNWPQAIYQYHASYNGLVIRPYYNGGGRQPYGAANAGGVWDLHISWNYIETVAQANTSYW